MNLYLTADWVGEQSGGGLVTSQELLALQELGETQTISRKEMVEAAHKLPEGTVLPEDPWTFDALSRFMFGNKIKLAHVYAGCFTESVKKLKQYGAKVTYTAAAHNINISKGEYEKLGIPFNYPHLTEKRLWDHYVGGYLAADVVICPSRHSAEVMKSYGCQNVKIVPHGVNLPEKVSPLPKEFRVGYLGSYGPDKGIIYLLQAWKRLAYKDATLILAGRDSTSPYVEGLVKQYGGGNIHLAGWMENVSDFYNYINLYVQPSMTEGFGCEVLEAMAHGRPVICSTGAGACDVIPSVWNFRAGDINALTGQISFYRRKYEQGYLEGLSGHANITWDDWIKKFWLDKASDYTWDKIRSQYIQIWKELMSNG